MSTIVVRGTLSMGSPTCRLKSSITITFVPSVGVNTSSLMLQVREKVAVLSVGLNRLPRLPVATHLYTSGSAPTTPTWGLSSGHMLHCPTAHQVTPTGKLDVHGALYSPTWTRLAATAYPGQRWVQVQAAVNWRAGQLVAVPTSLWKDECRNQVGGDHAGLGARIAAPAHGAKVCSNFHFHRHQT